MWNEISLAEVGLSEEALSHLRSLPWASRLVNSLDPTKNMRDQSRALLFEIRFAYALHQAGHEARYEWAGLESSTIDFCLATSDYQWRIELISVFESEAVQSATEQIGAFKRLILADKLNRKTGLFDATTSEAGEMIKVEEKIGEKVFSKGKATKFPEPSAGTIHVIMTDTRGYLGIAEHVIDNYDYVQISHGPAKVPDQNVQWWNNQPIRGLFQKTNPTKAAQYVRERIHILAFVCESEYTDTEICSKVFCAPNPHLFASAAQARAVMEQCPVRVCPSRPTKTSNK
jgi:hypothetical protein